MSSGVKMSKIIATIFKETNKPNFDLNQVWFSYNDLKTFVTIDQLAKSNSGKIWKAVNTSEFHFKVAKNDDNFHLESMRIWLDCATREYFFEVTDRDGFIYTTAKFSLEALRISIFKYQRSEQESEYTQRSNWSD